MRSTQVLLISTMLSVQPAAVYAEMPAAEVHYSPKEDLERIDLELIKSASETIDMAGYVLTDVAVINALCDAAERGVWIRLYLDPGHSGNSPMAAFDRIMDSGNIEVKWKRDHSPLMHLKSYAIDGRVLRTGAGNFSLSGLKRQDNDLVIIRDEKAVDRFSTAFEDMWSR
jgi:phosphatidylserine/phosphatidylglycerophosphate/cardiolipin synthase-like enzyme